LATSGSWHTAANWSIAGAPANRTPTTGDDVVIPDVGAAGANVTITFNSGTTAVNSITCSEHFTLSGGTLTVNGVLSVAGAFNFSSATLRNAQVTTTALMNVTTGGTLDAVTLGVNTTLREGTTGTGNQVTVLNGLTLDNATVRLERPSTFAG